MVAAVSLEYGVTVFCSAYFVNSESTNKENNRLLIILLPILACFFDIICDLMSPQKIKLRKRKDFKELLKIRLKMNNFRSYNQLN